MREVEVTVCRIGNRVGSGLQRGQVRQRHMPKWNSPLPAFSLAVPADHLSWFTVWHKGMEPEQGNTGKLRLCCFPLLKSFLVFGLQ